ncbi:hypothetical protein WM2015_1125 [Wenzhouxiangella marina]|uniref:Uncharacterized protein n=1 Tax=Wenzhouxiangella marina TaxID=1579979 RepID=A0A0K0XUW3_9GAMM|nr:hypothetical protein WM2015_1125 [Wenzhouxiangella marina]
MPYSRRSYQQPQNQHNHPQYSKAGYGTGHDTLPLSTACRFAEELTWTAAFGISDLIRGRRQRPSPGERIPAWWGNTNRSRERLADPDCPINDVPIRISGYLELAAFKRSPQRFDAIVNHFQRFNEWPGVEINLVRGQPTCEAHPQIEMIPVQVGCLRRLQRIASIQVDPGRFGCQNRLAGKIAYRHKVEGSESAVPTGGCRDAFGAQEVAYVSIAGEMYVVDAEVVRGWWPLMQLQKPLGDAAVGVESHREFAHH